jgi:hypothetical protein
MPSLGGSGATCGFVWACGAFLVGDGGYRNAASPIKPCRQRVRRIAQCHLGAQHEHRQFFQRRRQQSRLQTSQTRRARASRRQAGQHTALGVAIRRQARLADGHGLDVLRQLALQEVGRLLALGADHAQMGQGGDAGQGGGGCGTETDMGVNYHGRLFFLPC